MDEPRRRAYRIDIGGDAGAPVVAGDHNVIVNAQSGSTVTTVVERERPRPVRRERVALLPRRRRAPVGRDADVAALAEAVRAGGPVQLWGPAGIGKSSPAARGAAAGTGPGRRGVPQRHAPRGPGRRPAGLRGVLRGAGLRALGRRTPGPDTYRAETTNAQCGGTIEVEITHGAGGYRAAQPWYDAACEPIGDGELTFDLAEDGTTLELRAESPPGQPPCEWQCTGTLTRQESS